MRRVAGLCGAVAAAACILMMASPAPAGAAGVSGIGTAAGGIEAFPHGYESAYFVLNGTLPLAGGAHFAQAFFSGYGTTGSVGPFAAAQLTGMTIDNVSFTDSCTGGWNIGSAVVQVSVTCSGPTGTLNLSITVLPLPFGGGIGVYTA